MILNLFSNSFANGRYTLLKQRISKHCVPTETNIWNLNKLLQYREKLNITQEELAERAGVSTRTIQRIEKGTEPKGHTLKVLANALRVSENNLKENQIDEDTATYI